ncbi:MAG: MBL fold metallo-hydrolase [Fidelibacterota bacterium]
MKPIISGKIKVHLIWFDSMGAKASCILVETPDVKILIDPGTAEMQPGFPLSAEEKWQLRKKAFIAIKRAARRADTIFISHYHYDHHTLPEEAGQIYRNKKLWVKDPNRWINHSQWDRARLFLSQLYESSENRNFEEALYTPGKFRISDPLKNLPVASGKNYGDYQERKNELLKKGRKWFDNLVALWKKGPWVKPFTAGGSRVCFVDGKSFTVGTTKIRFTHPFFHGIEYDRIGWVIGFVLEYKKAKVLYTSDLQGPIIEDYADWIIREDPDVLVMDGPTTYLFGFMLNRINLNRVIENVCRILKNINPEVIIYDHHLPRDIRYRERVDEIYRTAKEKNINLITAAEWFGQEPLILKLAKNG